MKNKIVIGSILKPVNDARMYEKIAISISQLPDQEIHVAGFKGEVRSTPTNIQLHPLFDFKRLDFQRMRAPWKFHKLLLKVKPHTTIVTTHELLIVTVLYKILFGTKIIYDVQENYYRNIVSTKTFPPVLRNLIGAYVRLKEILTKPFISHYLLAEKNYEKEFSFTKGKSTILENKARKPAIDIQPRSFNKSEIRLLYTGTISEEYGIFEAVGLAEKLHRINPRITLSIIGYSSKDQTLSNLKELLKLHPYIQLKGGAEPVPHSQILEEIRTSDIGLLPYQPNPSTANCIPTKLYEYLAYRLPMVVNQNPIWDEIITKYKAGTSIDYQNFNPEALLQILQNSNFYTHEPGTEIYWEWEERKLVDLISAL